eukprot:TRINITY_DN8146_c2_g1_i1.p1 TRINITY_DN8146_c2_g1~~TRINITY_DN8146_c2_g1_i1.p1  ORF type:complete len:105 (+),score=22.92 TRINITY_DN8146_c2_g1_i1:44-358(+)
MSIGTLLVLFVVSADPCCRTCEMPTEKYYSIPKYGGHCGESCILPSEYPKYKVFEPHLEKANTSHPCDDYGFPLYWTTETHGKEIGLPIEVDFYNRTNTSAQPV